MAVHLAAEPPCRFTSLQLAPRKDADDSWIMVRRRPGFVRRTTLSADLASSSCCDVEDFGSSTSAELQETIQTSGDCMAHGDSGSTVLSMDGEMAGTAIGSTRGSVWFVRVDLSTLTGGVAVHSLLAAGPIHEWTELSLLIRLGLRLKVPIWILKRLSHR